MQLHVRELALSCTSASRKGQIILSHGEISLFSAEITAFVFSSKEKLDQSMSGLDPAVYKTLLSILNTSLQPHT
jgi:hypothetical protein